MDHFSLLPEGCVSDILSFTSPRDACRAAAISPGFKLAADSDTVWERFLPADCRHIISRSLSPVVFSTKKQLFFALSHSPLLIDEGHLSIGLEKESGKKCIMLGARWLSIIWGDEPRYWIWKSLSESRFAEVAQLRQVCWLEIKGRIDTQILSPKTTYVAYFVYKLEDGNHGIKALQLKASARVVDEAPQNGDGGSIVYLRVPSRFPGQLHDCKVPRGRMDGWMEVEIGEFFNDEGGSGEVEMRLLGTDGRSWKSGLIVEGFELRPKADI